MLRTPNEPILQLEGIDQQDFSKLQQVKGTFPFQIGLQQRLPGKTIQQIHAGSIGSIYVFYLVFGRHYQLIDFGNISIVEVPIPPITLPGLPPLGNTWFDTFSGYPPELISKLWGAGAWANSTGVCETIIDGFIDPFLVYANVAPGNEDPRDDEQPKPLPTPEEDPSIPPGAPTYGPAHLPPGTYTDYPISSGFENILRTNIISTGVLEEAPLPCNSAAIHTVAYIPIEYAPTQSASAALSAAAQRQSFRGCNNVAYSALNYKISGNSGYKEVTDVIINEMGINPRCQVFLIGTERKLDSSGNPVTIDVSDDMSFYINTEGAKYNVLPPADSTWHAMPASPFGEERIFTDGLLSWTALRVYDPAPL